MIKHEAHQVPVTALAFSKDLLFAGEGPVLRIYRRYDNQLHETFDVFPSQAIHGIVVYSEGLIIWGGNLVASYLFTADKASLRRPASFFEASDWILDISVAPETPGGTQKAALVTAHNALLLLDLKHLTTGLQDLTSSSRCILYSAHIHWTDSEHILVASGTVFGDIIVWTCILQQSGPCSSTLHHLLTGHEGSIFGVHIFEPSAGPSRLLASCSDDRTLRIWDISLLPETATTSQAVTDLTSIRETGFGLNIADVLPDTAVGGTCIATGWGHSSRIWGFKVVPSPDPQIISHIVSFGEDASRQLWSLRQTAPDEHSLSHIEGSTSHAGMNIWSWATVQDTPQQVIIASGGADGSIALESKSLPFTQESDYTRTWSMQDFSASSLGQSKSGPRDKLRTFAFLDSTKLLVTTNEGNIFLLAKAADQNTTMNWLCREERLRGYSVITSISSLSIAFLAGVDGSVIMYDGHGFYDLFKTNSKTSALFAHRLPSSKVPQARIGLLVANVEAKTALFSRFDMSSVCDATRAPEYTSSCQLLLPKAFVVTSFVITATGQDSKHTILLLGSRNGSIAIYLLDNLTNNREDTSVAHSYLLHKAHSIDAVTDLAWYDNHVFSVGRDGTFAVHQLVTSDSQLSLRLINQTVLPLGSNVEGVGIDEHNHHVLAWGFSGKRFVVYDVNDESEIMSVGCGGASRSWKFEPRETLQESHFGWIEASQLCLVSQGEQRKQGVNRGSHGREIKAVAVCPIKQRNAGVLFATGSEDTDIKLFTYSRLDEVPNFKCLRTLRKHNTGIRHLEWSSDGRYLFSSGGFEEFVVWRIEAAPVHGLGVVCESTCPIESALPDLRIMAFSIREDEGYFIITMVRSDSTIRMYQYSHGQDPQWIILMVGNYTTSCMTQCLQVERDHDDHVLITAGTDGHVAFFPFEILALTDTSEPDDLKWTHRSLIHQNTIHTMKLHWLDTTTCLLLTGGDDNAVAFTICTWHAGERIPEVHTLIVPRAHAAAVTGVEVLASPIRNVLTVATTSIDQRVKIWEVHYDPHQKGVDGLEVKRKENKFTAVADVSDLAMLDSSSFIICGVGIDVWKHDG